MPKVKCICKLCGKVFERFPSKAKNGRGIYCSNQCSHNDKHGVWRSRIQGRALAGALARGHNYPTLRMEKVCEQCGKSYEVTSKYREQRFCSRECQSMWQKIIKRGRQIRCICKHCGIGFEVLPSDAKRGGGIFCSRRCVNSHPPRGRRMNNVSTTPRPGCAYVLLADNGLYKIGCAGDFNRRLLQLKPILPYDLKPIAVIETEDMYKLEEELHNRFAGTRKKGEWFELEDEDIEYLKGLANE